jgi:Nucleotidyl transferase
MPSRASAACLASHACTCCVVHPLLQQLLANVLRTLNTRAAARATCRGRCAGTADAVRQYMWLFEDAVAEGVQDFLILSGDHLYRCNYQDFVREHRERGADITVAALPCDPPRASAFGLMKIDDTGKITSFAEKPTGDALKAMEVDTSILGLDPKKAKARCARLCRCHQTLRQQLSCSACMRISRALSASCLLTAGRCVWCATLRARLQLQACKPFQAMWYNPGELCDLLN